jgi:spore coat polysaccharide biosynthesis protein SpsF
LTSPLPDTGRSRVVAITQARMGSTRLPGKVAFAVCGRTLLDWHLLRLQCCPQFAEIVVATTTSPDDDPLVAAASRIGVRWYRGSEQDVLDRYLGAAREARAEAVVRVTSDCPLWDPGEGARVIASLLTGDPVDYAANIIERTLPRGLDTEALWLDVLERMARLSPAGPCPEREHVTYMLHASRPDLFVKRSVAGLGQDGDLRWCVDTREDLACITAIYAGLSDGLAPYSQVLGFVRAHPEISAMNAMVEQKAR